MSLSPLTRRFRHTPRDEIAGEEYDNAAAAADYVAAHEGWGPFARFFHSRLHVVGEALHVCPGGRLLDVGCGPGMLVGHLLDTRPDDFRITACDRSTAMIDATTERVKDADGVELTVARVEDMPFSDECFDVVLAMGVLEYADAGQAIREIARVLRPGGLVVATMDNPLGPYRLFEWFVYWPALRLLGWIERSLGKNPRHGAPSSGMRAIPAARLRRLLRETGLAPQETVYFDVTPLVPPLDRLVRRWSRRWRDHPERTVSRGAFRWLGTAYLVTARRRLPRYVHPA